MVGMVGDMSCVVEVIYSVRWHVSVSCVIRKGHCVITIIIVKCLANLPDLLTQSLDFIMWIQFLLVNSLISRDNLFSKPSTDCWVSHCDCLITYFSERTENIIPHSILEHVCIDALLWFSWPPWSHKMPCLTDEWWGISATFVYHQLIKVIPRQTMPLECVK